MFSRCYWKAWKIAFNKVLCDKAFNIINNQWYNGYERDLASMVWKCFSKKMKGSVVKSKFANTATLLRLTLMIIYKAFVKPHLDYGDLLYHKICNASFHQKLEKTECYASLTITGQFVALQKKKKKSPRITLRFSKI